MQTTTVHKCLNFFATKHAVFTHIKSKLQLTSLIVSHNFTMRLHY